MSEIGISARAVVNYFGLTSWEGGLAELPHLNLNKDEPLDFIRHLTGPILSFHGETDTVVPVDNTYDLDKACHRHKVEHQHTIYSGVNHSFIWPDSDNDKYDAAAHRDSWDKTIKFLKKYMNVSV